MTWVKVEALSRQQVVVVTSHPQEIQMSEPVKSFEKTFPASTAVRLQDLVEYGAGAVVSRTIAKSAAGTLTLFAFDEGQGLSEHTAPFDALVQVLDGQVRLTIGGEDVVARAGESVMMPAGVPHALHATAPMKMLLVMLRA